MSVGEIVAIVAVSITIIANLVCIGVFFGKMKSQSASFISLLNSINKTVETEINGMKEFFNFRLQQIEEDNKKRDNFEMEFKGCISKMGESIKSAHHRIAELKMDIKNKEGI